MSVYIFGLLFFDQHNFLSHISEIREDFTLKQVCITTNQNL